MDKDQPSSSNQYEMVSNSFVLLNELTYVSFHPPKWIIGNPFKGTKTKAWWESWTSSFDCKSNK